MKAGRKGAAWALLLALLLGGLGGFRTAAAAPLTLDVAEITGETTLQLYFSAEPTIGAATAAYVGLAEPGTLAPLADESGEPLFWEGALTGTVWTLSESAGTTLSGIRALVETDGRFAGKTVAFYLSETAGEKGDGFVSSVSGGGALLSATRPGSPDAFDCAAVSLSEPFTLKNVYQYNDTHLMLEFSEAFRKTAGYDAWVRVVNDQNQLQKQNGANLQGKVVWSGLNGAFYGKQNTESAYRMFGTLCHPGSAGALANKTYSEIRALVDEHNAQPGAERWTIKFMLTEPISSANRKEDGVITYFRTLKGNRPLQANVLSVPGQVWNSCFVEITPVTETVSVRAASLIDPTTLEITFSEPIATEAFLPAETAAPYYGIRLVNEKKELQKKDGKNLQWAGSLLPTNDPAVYRFSIRSTTFGVGDLQSIAALARETGLEMTFCIEQNTAGCGDILKVVDNITSQDGVRKLAATEPSANGSYTAVSLPQAEPLELVSAVAQNDSQILATFNRPVQITGSPLLFVRLVGEGDAVVSREGTVLQWGGVFDWADEAHTSLLWTMAGQTLGIANLSDLLRGAGLEEELAAGGELKFAVVEQGQDLSGFSRENGLVDNLWAVGDATLLRATSLSTTANNGAYCPISLAENYDTEPLTVTYARQLDESRLEVGFSAPVEIGEKALAYLCLVDENDNIVHAPSMRWGGSWAYADEAQSRIVFTLTRSVDNDLNLRNLSELRSLLEQEEFAPYRFRFSLVEQRAGQVHELGNGIVADVLSRGKTKALHATRVVRGENDRTYTDLEWLDYDPTPVVLESARFLNDTQLEILFSEPVRMEGAPYSFLRLVDESGAVVFLNGRPVQFGGALRVSPESASRWVYTLSGASNAWPMSSLAEIVGFGGELAGLKDKGYEWKFCLAERGSEELPALSNHLVDNISSALRPKKLTANVSNPGAAEAAAVALPACDLPETELTLLSVRIIGDREAILTFSAPVEISGTPWLALGLADEQNRLIYRTPENTPTTDQKGNTSMQWGGGWRWHNEEHTQIVWTMARKNHTGILNLADLFARRGLENFEEYALRFRIEEAGEQRVGNDLRIGNIALAADPRVRLRANTAMGADRLWTDISVEADLTPISARAEIISDQQIRVRFSEPVEIAGEPFLALRYVENGRLLWDGEPDQSFPLQFTGRWEWADEEHRSILWTMDGANRYGANNLYEAFHYRNGLVRFEGAEIAFCLEESAPKGIGGTGLLENIASLDGARHLVSSDPVGNDRLYLPLTGILPEEELFVEKVEALDDQTLRVVFSGAARIAEGENAPSMAVRYLTESGATHSVADGRSAVFNGSWKWEEGSDRVMIWTLDPARARGAESLTEIFQFAGDFRYNRGARIAFCIQDSEAAPSVAYGNRLFGITDPSGVSHLKATRNGETCSSVTEISVLYPLPGQEPQTPAEPALAPAPLAAYRLPIALSGAAILCGALGMAVLLLTKKSRRREAR